MSVFTPEQRIAAFTSGDFVLDTDSAQAQNLVGWWPLGVHGGNAKDRDYSLFKNHGTRNNGPIRKVSNHPRWGGIHALSFDGDDDNVIAPIDTSLFGSQAAFCVWIKRTLHDPTTEGNSGIWSLKDGGTSDHYPFSDGNIYVGMFDSTRFSMGDIGIADRTVWHHVTITRTAGTNGWKFRQNGAVIFETDPNTFTLGTTVKLGESTSAVNNYDGLMNDARLYNIAQPAGLIDQIYNEPWRLVYPLGVRTISLAPAGVSVALTGTVTASIDETDIVTGAKETILTVTGDTWVSA